MDSTPFVTVVSGLPRSGTSLLMQMLRAGGMPLLCDASRGPDASNPAGYFEYEPVKRTVQDASWVAAARGRAVKVIHALLRALPAGERYRVLWLRRSLAEVLASQQRMLERLGTPDAAIPAERLARIFAAQLAETEAWIGRDARFRLLRVEHRELIFDPRRAAEEIRRFLGAELDVAAMAGEVDPGLYRERASDPA